MNKNIKISVTLKKVLTIRIYLLQIFREYKLIKIKIKCN